MSIKIGSNNNSPVYQSGQPIDEDSGTGKATDTGTGKVVETDETKANESMSIKELISLITKYGLCSGIKEFIKAHSDMFADILTEQKSEEDKSGSSGVSAKELPSTPLSLGPFDASDPVPQEHPMDPTSTDSPISAEEGIHRRLPLHIQKVVAELDHSAHGHYSEKRKSPL